MPSSRWIVLALVVCLSAVQHYERPFVEAQGTDPYQLAQLMIHVCTVNQQASQVPVIEDVQLMREILNFYDKSGAQSWCAPEFATAIQDLKVVLSDQVLGDSCSAHSMAVLRLFHAKYIHYFVPQLTSEQLKWFEAMPKQERIKPAPETVRQFFILFAKQVNANCRENLVYQISHVMGQINVGAELAAFEELKRDAEEMFGKAAKKSNARSRIRKVLNLDDLQLFSELRQLPFAVPVGNVIVRTREACTLRWRPFYESTFMPLIELNNLGYLDKRLHPKAALEQQLAKMLNLNQVYEAIQICETFKALEIIERPVFIGPDGQPAAKLGMINEAEAQEARMLAVQRSYGEPLHLAHRPIGFAWKTRLQSRQNVDQELRAFTNQIESIVRARLERHMSLSEVFAAGSGISGSLRKVFSRTRKDAVRSRRQAPGQLRQLIQADVNTVALDIWDSLSTTAALLPIAYLLSWDWRN